MPTEKIMNERFIPESDDRPAPVLAVKVSWGRDSSDVQIATVDESAPPHTVEHGWHLDLNRAQINRLIRVLRKARDQAFGQDA